MRATIKDVSREAGVSIKTVSRVLNNEPHVGADTRARVEAAVSALDFRPSSAARALAGRRAFQIALVCDGGAAWQACELQAGIRERCAADGVRLVAHPHSGEGLAEAIAALVDTSHLDGVILAPPASDDAAVQAVLADRGLRVVRTGTGGDVFVDDARAAAATIAHLLALGHRRIAHIAGPDSRAESARRLAGYRMAMAAAGIADTDALVVRDAADFAAGAAAAAALLARADPPTAIFAASDEIAAGALAAAHARGLAVPGALSVAGFGDDPLAAFVWPPLTTAHEPVRRIGWHAADLLLADAAAPIQARELPCPIMIRGSTGPIERDEPPRSC